MEYTSRMIADQWEANIVARNAMLRNIRKKAEEQSRPIFIVGANRSGTTLLRLILNAHSRIGIPDELVYFNSRLAGVPIENWRAPGLSRADYAAFVTHFLEVNCAVLSLNANSVSVRQAIMNEDLHDFRRPYQLVLEQWAHQYGKVRWGEKTPGNLFYADILVEMFPKAKFVYMVRDPRAGVSSMQRAHFFGNDVVFNALARDKHFRAGRDVLEGHVPSEQRMAIRYEDLVREPERTVRELCQFLGEEFEPVMLSFHKSAGEYMKAEAANDFNAAAMKPISTAMLDTWNGDLEPCEVAVVESLCADEMRAYGYTRAGASLSLRCQLSLYVKKTYWYIQCWRRRHIRHYTIKHEMFARSRHRLRGLFQRRVPTVESMKRA